MCRSVTCRRTPISSDKLHLSSEFATRIIGVHGESGSRWLTELPIILASAAERWSLELLPPFVPLAYNYVAPATRTDGTRAVLKAGVPHRELTPEINALCLYGGEGAVRLLDSDAPAGLMLLERLEPGATLEILQDEEKATTVFCQVAGRLRKPPPEKHAFPTVEDWAQAFASLRRRFNGRTGPCPEPVIERAERLHAELVRSMSEVVVLHGDLHHRNILSSERDLWLAIDPKGVIGEAEYEVGAWLRNPYPQLLSLPNPKAVIERKVDQLAEGLGFDRERMVAWGYAQVVLSAVWSYEDGQADWPNDFVTAEHLASLLP